MALDANGNYYANMPEPLAATPACSKKWCVGDGAPADSQGQNGSLWLDRTTGSIYEKVDGVWEARPGGAGLGGTVDPEGNQSASPFAIYYNSVTGSFWVKATGQGTNTGWVALIE